MNTFEDLHGGVVFTDLMRFDETARLGLLEVLATDTEAALAEEKRRKAAAEQIMRTGLVPRPDIRINFVVTTSATA